MSVIWTAGSGCRSRTELPFWATRPPLFMSSCSRDPVLLAGRADTKPAANPWDSSRGRPGVGGGSYGTYCSELLTARAATATHVKHGQQQSWLPPPPRCAHCLPALLSPHLRDSCHFTCGFRQFGEVTDFSSMCCKHLGFCSAWAQKAVPHRGGIHRLQPAALSLCFDPPEGYTQLHTSQA